MNGFRAAGNQRVGYLPADIVLRLFCVNLGLPAMQPPDKRVEAVALVVVDTFVKEPAEHLISYFPIGEPGIVKRSRE
jgi:hypothetical protein